MLQDYKWLRNAVKKSPLSLAVSRVNRIALQENALRLLMSVTFGENLQGSFAKCSPDGWWLRTYQGCCQVSMDGFLDEFSETWPQWGTMRGGECFRLSMPGWPTKEKDFALLPTPTASDGMAWMTVEKNALKTMRVVFGKKPNPSKHLMYLSMLCGCSADQTANFYETIMGFPPHWTDLNASETP